MLNWKSISLRKYNMFQILKLFSDAKKGIKDPGGLGKEVALDIIKIPLLVFTLGGGLFLALMAVLGFSTFIGGPYLFFKVVFILLLIPYVIFQLIGWTLYKKIESVVEKARQKVNEKIVEGTVE